MSEKPANHSRMIMLLAIAAAIVLMLIALPLSGIGKRSAPATDADGADSRIQPVAKFDLQLAAKGGGGPKTAESIFNGVCAACHGTGVAGAPKKGDKAAWAPRLKVGIDGLVKSATAGKGAMPPKGGAADLSEAELKSVIELMTR